MPPKAGKVPSLNDDGSFRYYDDKEYYTGTKNDHDHYAEIYKVKYPANLEGVMDAIVNDKASGYRSRADFIRDAMVHNCHKRLGQGLGKNDLPTNDDLEAVVAMLRVQRRRDVRDERRQYVEAVETELHASGAYRKMILSEESKTLEVIAQLEPTLTDRINQMFK